MNGLNATERQLLINKIAELQAASQGVNLEWWGYACMVVGAFTILLVAGFALFVLVDVLTEKRWLRASEPDPDVPNLPGIVSAHEVRNWNRSNTLSFEDFKRETNT